jgi:uncharacterized cupredoxin-like copper-binding protein
MPRRRSLLSALFVAAVALAALVLAACGGGYGGGSNNSGSGAVSQTIRISEKEYSVNPGSVALPKAGTYAFEITNDGKITHAFTIEASGGGGKEVQSGSIDPGSRKTVKYSFAAGASYEMYCPIDGHKAQGMAGTIKVGGAAGGGTTTGPAGGTTTSSMPGY